MHQVISKSIETVSKEEIIRANDLTDLTWPNTKPSNYTEDSRLVDFLNRNIGKTCHFIFDGNDLIAYAESFPREIKADGNKVTIMGLGAVCVHPEHKGKGLGALVVREAFSRVDKTEFPLSLFQTGVPGFYHKLNCRTINNRIYNSIISNQEESPFWDPYVMVYPRQFIGFQSDIDLLGAGY